MNRKNVFTNRQNSMKYFLAGMIKDTGDNLKSAINVV